MKSLRVSTLSWIGIAGVTGCVVGDASAAREPSADAGQESEADEPGAGQRINPTTPCHLVQGSVTMPATSSAELLWNSSGELEVTGPWLPIVPDRVELTTLNGETQTCQSALGTFSCSTPDEFDEVIATYRGAVGSERNWCNHIGDFSSTGFNDKSSIRLTSASCVADGTIVVEGELLGYDPARAAPHVMLEGPPIDVGDSPSDLYVVGTQCSVEDGHYACPAVGFMSSETHTVVAGGARTEVVLHVDDCSVEPVQLDVRCPEQPQGIVVKAPYPGRNYRVTASYEGGEPYACDRFSLSFGRDVRSQVLARVGQDFLCPLAKGNERGSGTYHIIADDILHRARAPSSSPALLYEIDVRDALDGCGGSRELVTFGPL